MAQDQALSKEKEREALIEELAVADSSDKIKSIVARSASQAVASSTSVGTIQYAVDIPIVTLEDEEEYLEELALLEDEDMEDPFEVLYVPPYTLAPNYIDP